MDGEIVDSHCHLDFKNFNQDRDDVIRRAFAGGILAIVNSGYDYVSNQRTIELSRNYSRIYPTLGLSPNRIDSAPFEWVEVQIRDFEREILAVGEIGLDFYHEKRNTVRNRQREIFEKMLDLAEELGKPVVIHARDSEREAYDLIKRKDLEAVFHCYSGDLKTMRAIEDSGFYVSISTLVCFSDRHKKIAENVSPDHLLVETDSPFLSPRRGRNEPLFVWDAVNTISRLKDMEIGDLCNAILRNINNLFKI